MNITPDSNPQPSNGTTPATDVDAAPDAGIPELDHDELGKAFAERFAQVRSQINPFPELAGEPTEPTTDAEPAAGTEPVADAEPAEPATEPEPLDPSAQGAGDGEPTIPVQGGLTVPLPDGTETTVTPDQVTNLLNLQAWATGLSDDQRGQMAAIETGQAVAIPRAEFEQFMVWREQRNRQPQPDVYTELDAAGVDPDMIARLRERDVELERLRELASRPTEQQQHAANQGYDQRVAEYNQGVQEWAASRGITDRATIDRLNDTAVNAGVIAGFVQRGTQFSPTGQIIRPADLKQVARQAMEFALVTDPELHTEVLTHAPASTPAPTPPDPVSVKKARASSLASAPSTAVPQPSGGSQQPQSMQGLIDSMAHAFEQAQSGTT